MSQGIFALETEWFNDYKRPMSVAPGLELLSTVERIRYIHRHVATIEEFRFYINLWLQARHRDHPILYLAFHGDHGVLQVGDQRRKEGRVTLDWLGSEIGSRGQGRLLYFGSCLTMNVPNNRLTDLLAMTGLEGAVGYGHVVAWMNSAIFDLFVLRALGQAPSINGRRLMRIDALARERLQGLYRKLNFHVAIRP